PIAVAGGGQYPGRGTRRARSCQAHRAGCPLVTGPRPVACPVGPTACRRGRRTGSPRVGGSARYGRTGAHVSRNVARGTGPASHGRTAHTVRAVAARTRGSAAARASQGEKTAGAPHALIG